MLGERLGVRQLLEQPRLLVLVEQRVQRGGVRGAGGLGQRAGATASAQAAALGRRTGRRVGPGSPTPGR
ncbi:hypothetical protein GCM10025868_23660 [Angustibacter aerolatus]|uniref:Uncharacterized protein n=1 Tax=Angustibacter aerolatus TaxID=1162965 RepID=A0ABQ6JFY5_9ACTN|nr:hypothetical protein GCM10025868_23660 [Angustibacter aerolatus]